MANAALRLPDEHDFELVTDPGDPCPGCQNATLEDGICSVCQAEFCEGCGKVEVTGVSACCGGCAPVYTISIAGRDVYQTRNLRRAWEAQRYFDEQEPDYGASLLNRNRNDYDSDGITDREQALLESWETWISTDIGRRVASVHLCLQWGA
jgi:hypothetical protein